MYKYAIFITTGCLLMACSKEEKGPNTGMATPAVPVRIEIVVEQAMPQYIESLGTLKPTLFVEVRPQVSGMLQEVNFVEGETVQKDQPLFTIDPKPYRIKRQEAEAQLQQNKTALDASRKKLERFESLAKKDLIPQQEWDDLVSQTTRHEAQLLADEARLEAAELDLQHCTIVAPIAGKTSKCTLHQGNLVSPSQQSPLVSMADVSLLTIDFTLSEQEFQQMKKQGVVENHPLDIYAFTDPSTVVTGRLTFFDHSFDRQTGLLHLRGEILNYSNRFLPGQVVKVRLPVSVVKDAKVISQKSVRLNQSGPYVYVVGENQTVELRQIKTAEEFGEKVAVSEGLQAGERVITEGHLRLHPGTAVEIKDETVEAPVALTPEATAEKSE